MTRVLLLVFALAPLAAGCGDDPPRGTAPLPPIGDKFQKGADKPKAKPGRHPAPKVGCRPRHEPAVGWRCPGGHAAPTRSST